MAKKIIVANWKMNHAFEEADHWLSRFLNLFANNSTELSNFDIVICPPSFLMDYLDAQLLENIFENLEKIMKKENKKIEDLSEDRLLEIVTERRQFLIGAQDCHHEDSGSFTGDLSAEMMKKNGADYVILGHSERRENHFETDEIVAKKIIAAVKRDIVPILCVGESKEIRDQKKYLEFIYKQLLLSIPRGIKFNRFIVAYEPIWSIGTGVLPTLEQIAEVAKLIKKILVEKGKDFAEEFFVLYGGSVNDKNAAEILNIENVDGLLVGKASLDADTFVKICLS